MIPESKGLIYSYKDFKSKDFDLLDSDINFNVSEVEEVDCINLDDFTTAEHNHFVSKYWVRYERDIIRDNIYTDKYFFKDFTIKYPSDDDIDIEFVNRYTISGWDAQDERKGIDSRTLTIDLFSYDNNTDIMYRDDRFLLKTKHLYQLILDLRNYRRYLDQEILIKRKLDKVLVSDNDVNLYVLPIYILVQNRYVRISDVFYHRETYEELSRLLDNLYNSIKLFLSTNYYMLDMYNSNGKVSVYNTKTRKMSNITFKAYSVTANSNKKVYSHVDTKSVDEYTPTIEIQIDSDRSNILCGTTIPRRLCDYRFTVRGHWAHRWVGKKGNQRLQKIWINSYEKNKDKPFKIIKETKLK